RLLVRYLPEYIVGPFQYATYRVFDRWVAKLIARDHFDAVIAYENSAIYTFEAAKKSGAVCILDAASLHRAEQDRYYISKLPRAYKARVDLQKDKELSLADCILTASELAAKSYLTHTHSRSCIKTLLLGVDLDRFKPATRPRSSEELHQPLTFVFVGSANVNKGFDLILDCMDILLSEGWSVELLVAGKVDQHLILGRSRLRKNVRECGIVSQRQLASLITNAHCLLLPSRFDSFGMVVAEAMACGLPVIVSDMVGARQLVEQGRNGFVVPVGNRDALACKMRWCVFNREALTKMSIAARTSAEQVSWVNYRRNFVTAVREVLLQRAA